MGIEGLEEEKAYQAGLIRKMVKTMRRIVKMFFDAADKETSVADIVGNLRHYCDAEGIDWDEVRQKGEDYYYEEKALAGQGDEIFVKPVKGRD